MAHISPSILIAVEVETSVNHGSHSGDGLARPWTLAFKIHGDRVEDGAGRLVISTPWSGCTVVDGGVDELDLSTVEKSWGGHFGSPPPGLKSHHQGTGDFEDFQDI